jgi:hypothetical protein
LGTLGRRGARCWEEEGGIPRISAWTGREEVDVIAELVRGVTADAARIGLSTVSNSGSAATLPTEDGGCNDSVAGAAVSSGIGAGGMLSVTDD